MAVPLLDEPTDKASTQASNPSYHTANKSSAVVPLLDELANKQVSMQPSNPSYNSANESPVAVPLLDETADPSMQSNSLATFLAIG